MRAWLSGLVWSTYKEIWAFALCQLSKKIRICCLRIKRSVSVTRGLQRCLKLTEKKERNNLRLVSLPPSLSLSPVLSLYDVIEFSNKVFRHKVSFFEEFSYIFRERSDFCSVSLSRYPLYRIIEFSVLLSACHGSAFSRAVVWNIFVCQIASSRGGEEKVKEIRVMQVERECLHLSREA